MDFFHVLLSLSFEKKYDVMVRNIQEYKSKNFFSINKVDLDNFLTNCEFEIHSLLFIHITDNIPMSTLYKHFYAFLINYDPEQVLYAPKKFYDIVENFIKYFMDNNIGVKILKPLLIAVNKMEYLGLTPLHNFYLMLCLRTKMYKEGLKLANKPIGCLSKKTCNFLNL